jgi:antirestriction protein ArdC
MSGGKKSTGYAYEELIAEIGAAFLCGITGIESATLDNSAAYIQSWLSHLRNDPKLVIQASSKAQKAMDYLDVELIKTQEDEN